VSGARIRLQILRFFVLIGRPEPRVYRIVARLHFPPPAESIDHQPDQERGVGFYNQATILLPLVF
jgi:hypothetical protein